MAWKQPQQMLSTCGHYCALHLPIIAYNTLGRGTYQASVLLQVDSVKQELKDALQDSSKELYKQILKSGAGWVRAAVSWWLVLPIMQRNCSVPALGHPGAEGDTAPHKACGGSSWS
jgi:hypothetical protein